jgi:hypothetical protein
MGSPSGTTALSALSSMTSSITDIQTKHALYLTAKTNQSATLTSNTNLNTQNSELELELRELSRQEETLNKQFLDARKNVAPAGVFARLGLSTMQDWVLAAFFFTFGLFGIILTMFLASNSLFAGRVVLFGIIMTVILMASAAMLIRVLG